MDHRRRKRVVPEHPIRRRLNENERGGHTFVGVVARLVMQVTVEGFRATSEAATVVTLFECLDAVRGLRLVRQSQPHLLAICGGGSTQSR